VFGISCDSLASHEQFSGKFDLNFPLLCDEDHSVCENFGVWVEKNRFGKKSMGIQRATFLIGKDGVISRVWPTVNVDGHVDEVADAVASI
jgi:thioredoxin-dependent peroxiredoxin